MIYHDFIIKITDKATILTWLNNHGIDINRDEDGIVLSKAEKMIGSVCTPVLHALDGNKYIRIRFKENIASKIPDFPNYVMWRSDVEDPGQEPLYEVDLGEGLTRMQQVGGF